jgi:alanine-glyoxylate transaminase/serine-glyoxylate transaminase/serine-pyruvate transaminase
MWENIRLIKNPVLTIPEVLFTKVWRTDFIFEPISKINSWRKKNMKSHKILMIPGPIEFDSEVLAAVGKPTTSHNDPDFIDAFGASLEMMRQVFLSEEGQPFVVPGSGTLAMDSAAANLVEPGDAVLMLNTGYFSDRFTEILQRYGAQVTEIQAPIGARPNPEEVKKALQQKKYKLLVLTHVETSTGVLNDVQTMANLAQEYGALCVVDGICSIGAEEFRMSEWNVDVALTASQKALGVPPGLALWMVSRRALEVFKRRSTPVMNYYGDWNKWLPVMQSHETRKPDYFGTPAINLVWGLHTSLRQILKEGMEQRFNRHRLLSRAFKAAVMAWELDQVPQKPEFAAHTVSAVRYPTGVEAAKFLPEVAKQGIVISGGLHPQIKNEYFRVGHMGTTTLGDLIATVSAVEQALRVCGYPVRPGSGLAAAQVEAFGAD